jgi:hypothetical protein
MAVLATPLRSSARRRPGNAADNIDWLPGSAKEEAKSLFKFMERTHASVKEMVELICISDAEYKAICEWAMARPTIAGKLHNMVAYRDKVLKHFQAMLEL